MGKNQIRPNLANLIRSGLDFAASVTSIFVKISFENGPTRILGLSQIFARKKVRSSTFRAMDFLSEATIAGRSCGLFERKHRVQSW